ncbi:MAG: hypothetical protein AUJ92_09660 [Armatimonadetes bacterium CG2_30_59_28]|nr:ATP-dependent Clp protease adaptor ClpS [Armatimonadota bacterium]OIO94677.1 MAG: hypothetical protein AUJ92_09660 [Armatimonadetes bacterium CG2_30_59_28]PIU67316.1 MAG: Clp protease ClpS [Armatimonadetes bacterium CG07_land_8_20_14_0_80_59_28]PIX39752.1 MAG: Clp protease ClpS [Armatimonadetes bacterium CG_4_8_14_3_um_filter_58_9]PIY37248.1 MAG: Clp protease ClpS [Armatimonadetes bacterium CG_4_10_14_3_um_filter_59_10]PJB73335.1 MAG: Clp protease ClpS [Armatimonadetes bacterium CG_4_9_14_3
MPVQTIERADVDTGTGVGHPWSVVIYNDDWHSFDDVVRQVQRATGCALERAEQITYEAHTRGRAIAYCGDKEKCQEVASVLREIRLQVEIDDD